MNKLPVLLLKSFVIFPNQETKLELNNEISKNIISLSYKKYNKNLLVICPLDEYEESPDVSDLPNIGVSATIVSKLVLPNGNIRITLKGLNRVAVTKYENNEEYKYILESVVEDVVLPNFAPSEELALRKKINELLEEYVNKDPSVSNDILYKAKNTNNFYRYTDIIATFLDLSTKSKLSYMQEINPLYRAENLIKDLNLELQVIKIDEKLEEKLGLQLDESQKEFILREKLKQIKEELHEDDSQEDEKKLFLDKAKNLKLNEKSFNHIQKEITKYSLTNESSPENTVIHNYIDTFLSLPWQTYSNDETNLNKIVKSLNKSHYGLEEVKDRILEYIASKKHHKDIKSPIICLIGPPGVGKSTFAYTISKALNKKFYKISVGGLNDPAELLGHRRTYVGASPGKIMLAMQKCGVSNPVILIDEVDKMAKDIKGDPASALLDILDSNSNDKFVDNYIEEPFDLSKVLFILTANSEENIPSPLKDRLEMIYLSGYSEFEKIAIAEEYIIPKIFEENKLSNEIKFSKESLKVIINEYTKESGVRDLTRNIEKIVRKIITKSYLEDTALKATIKKNDIAKYLGPKKFDNLRNDTKNNIGIINALAYTSLGGEVLPIETISYDGTGKITYTGNLGKVIEESVLVSLSYIKANNKIFKIKTNFDKTDLHINFLSSAIKKDGPSAGIAITTSLLSIFLNKNIANDVAMTGEISLNGDVLKIGGLKEKIIGAYNHNIKKIFIPEANISELDSIDDRIKEHLEIIPVKNYRDIYKTLF